MYWKNFFSETFGGEGFTKINHKIYKKLGINAAFWIAEMHSWNRRLDIKYGENRKEPEWFYYEQRRMEEKGLSTQIQTRVSNKLSKIGLIEKKRMGNPSKNWYKINYELLTTYCFNSLETINLIGCNQLNQLDSINNKINNNKIKESTPALFSKPKIPADWKSSDHNEKNKYLHNTYPKLNPIYLRFVLKHQEAQIENFPMSFKSFTDQQLINQIVNGTKVITRLKKTGLSFSNLIKPVIEWGRDKSDFWPKQLISLAEINKISKNNGQMKIMNIQNDWCEATGIDPKVGRYLDEKDFKITTGFEKWDAKTPEEKRKAQDEFVPRRRPPLPPDFKHPENFKPEEIPQFMKDIFNYN